MSMQFFPASFGAINGTFSAAKPSRVWCIYVEVIRKAGADAVSLKGSLWDAIHS
jgi:hypothetical protein